MKYDATNAPWRLIAQDTSREYCHQHDEGRSCIERTDDMAAWCVACEHVWSYAKRRLARIRREESKRKLAEILREHGRT